MIKPKFFGTIQNGKFIHHDPDIFSDYVRKFVDGKQMELTIGPKVNRRSSGAPGEMANFNGYYWAVIVRIISDTIGELDDNLTHSMLQMLFNKKGIELVNPETGQKENMEIPRGTKDLTSGEFAEYCSRIRIWAAIPGNLCEKGCYIPSPHEADYDN